MRLLKIGRDASCDIVLHSDKVSAIHAEITLLNNGDISLEDKGSHNGTFVMNRPIKPGTPVNIRRGDAIRFADVELQWSQVPMPEDNSNFKGIWSIGSHFNNDIQISGNTVSRYHATIKLSRDGKFYITDHSKNGTMVNGVKIPQNQPTLLKKGYQVVCGGVSVDLSSLPWPKGTWKTILAIAAALLIVCGIGFGAYKFIKPEKTFTMEQINARYKNSVVMLVGTYHYEVSAGDLDLSYFNIPTKFMFVTDGKGNEKIVNLESLSPEDRMQYCMYFGTGFFVSNDGQLLTNLHVAKPWLVHQDMIEAIENHVKRIIAQAAEARAVIRTINGVAPEGISAYISQVKVTGVSDGILLVPQGRYFTEENAIKCKLLSGGDDLNKDVALIQSERMELPNSKCTFVNVADSMDVNEVCIETGHELYTIGFPAPTTLQDSKNEKGMQSLCHGGRVSRESTEFNFMFDATTAGGASGSPIFNEHGMLVGILNATTDQKNFTWGIKAKYIKELLDSPHSVK